MKTNDLDDVKIMLNLDLTDLEKIENMNVFKILLTNYTNNIIDYVKNPDNADYKLGIDMTLAQLIKFVHKHI
jgi:hypothetical protein